MVYYRCSEGGDERNLPRREVIRMKEKILKFIDDTIEVVEKLIKLVFAISSLLAVIKILFL